MRDVCNEQSSTLEVVDAAFSLFMSLETLIRQEKSSPPTMSQLESFIRILKGVRCGLWRLV